MLIETIKTERKRLKITQFDLAKRAKIGYKRYMAMENGGRCSDAECKRLLAELNLKILVVTSVNFINA